jgi:hypothetical protein
LPVRQYAKQDATINQPQHVMSGGRDIGKIRFAGEAMTPLKRLILGELLRQCF